MHCCSRIEILQKKTLGKCKDYKMLVMQEVRAGNYEAAEPYADTLLLNMHREKWYRVLYAHVSTLEVDHLKGRVRSCKDVRPMAFPHCVTLVYASTLVGSELPELGDIARLIVKLLGKVIDKEVNHKGYTESLVREKFSTLMLVDEDIVNTLPGGSNWTSSPFERLNLVLGLCDAKKIDVHDKQRLRAVMLGNGAARRTASTSTGADGFDDGDGIDERYSYTTYTTETDEHMGGGEAFATPTSKLVDSAGNKKKPAWKQGKKKKKKSSSGSDAMETWQMFEAKRSPASTGPGKEGVAAQGRTSVSGCAEVGLEGGTDESDDEGGSMRPGWGPPQPKFAGNSLSFGPRLENMAQYMARRSSSE